MEKRAGNVAVRWQQMVKGTGPDDRITAKDVETFVVSGPPPVAAAVAPTPTVAAAAPAPVGIPAASFEDIPLTSVRQVSNSYVHLRQGFPTWNV